jgi:hypothetical protein
MPAWALRREAAALLGYVCVAAIFSWPLPLHLADAMLGLPAGDAGVYVWNLWVFRHEIVDNHRLPFLTSEILALSQPVPLALHNYTTFANLLALPLIPVFGVVKTFNLLSVGAGVMSGYAMYLYARERTGDRAAAWIGGLLFGFSPFMSARASEHFSLTLAAPLPLFAWLMHRLHANPSPKLACAAGATVAWAFLCDVYFAVYCVMIAAFTVLYSAFSVERQDRRARSWPRALVDLSIVCVAGLIVGMVLRGGGRMDVFGIRVSFTRLYTPVLVLTVLVIARALMSLRPRLVPLLNVTRYAPLAVVAGLVCTAVLSPVLSASTATFSQRNWISPTVPWRNSAPGVDLLAYFMPNPLNPIVGSFSHAWYASLPNGFSENVASIPWVALGTIAACALWTRRRPHKGCVVFTCVFAFLALGPFVSIAGRLTYVPTPWAVFRYLPIVGAARMPTRMTILVTMGVALLLAFAVRELRTHARRPRLVTAAIASLLAIELLPAPRTLHSAELPAAYQKIAADPRPIRVLSLPFGLRDGLGSRGNYSSTSQFYQTFHRKRLVGGYVSRLPAGSIDRYRGNSTLKVLLRMSEGTPVESELLERAYRQAPRTLDRLQIGYVVIDRTRTAAELRDFAQRAFALTPVMTDGTFELYYTRLAPPVE